MCSPAEWLTAVLWPAVAAYAVWRVAAVADQWAPARRPAPEAGPSRDIVVPDDLVALALTHTEQWAQEDTIRAMRERYAELGDWQKVRFAFGIGRLDA